jgi:hypothetical protein
MQKSGYEFQQPAKDQCGARRLVKITWRKALAGFPLAPAGAVNAGGRA